MVRNILRLIPSLILLCIAAAGCSSSSKTTTTKAVAAIDTSSQDRTQFIDWLNLSAARGRSLSVTGDISLDQGGSSNSATFAMKSKRLREPGPGEADPTYQVLIRVDSLSLEVKGPFGIKVARFLASPERYQFYDILHDEPLSGPTDSKSIEALTHLNGVSLSMMSDLVYGLVPDGSRINPEDSVAVYSTDQQRTMVLIRANRQATEAINLDLKPGEDFDALTKLRYRRWNGVIADPVHAKIRPAVWVQFSNYSTINGVVMPGHIEAVAEDNKLTLDYTDIQVNPASLVVKIKMP
jgi:hypothetical protein